MDRSWQQYFRRWKTYFRFQSLRSYFSSLWSSMPWTLGTTVGSGISAPSLWALRVGDSKLPGMTVQRDKALFVLFPCLSHTGVPSNAEWVNKSPEWQAAQASLNLSLYLPGSWGPFPSDFSVLVTTLFFLLFSVKCQKLGYGSQSPKWPPVVPSSHILMQPPLTLYHLYLCDQKAPCRSEVSLSKLSHKEHCDFCFTLSLAQSCCHVVSTLRELMARPQALPLTARWVSHGGSSSPKSPVHRLLSLCDRPLFYSHISISLLGIC